MPEHPIIVLHSSSVWEIPDGRLSQNFVSHLAEEFPSRSLQGQKLWFRKHEAVSAKECEASADGADLTSRQCALDFELAQSCSLVFCPLIR